MSSIRAAETRAEAMPVDEKETIKEDEIETVNEREQLYMDVLYSITNTVGCQQPGGQVETDTGNLIHSVLFCFSFHSLHTTKMRCTSQLNVHSALHPTDIIDCYMPLRKKNPRLLSYQ
jgi:hypothetical protein